MDDIVIDKIVAELERNLPPIVRGTLIDDLTGGSIHWPTIQNRRSKGEIPEECFIRSGPTVLIVTRPFLKWFKSTLRPTREGARRHTPRSVERRIARRAAEREARTS
jgi:hypothetical protein